ncbi:hypothetical protein B0H12DRAFT_1201254 [Mycena haematopus]|nr:hypothetical protein B0H12DRAFT_1201254 [Mycena haematopus]
MLNATQQVPHPQQPRQEERTTIVELRHAAAASLPKKTARRPTKGRELKESIFRPHVPADRRVLIWTAPYSATVHRELQSSGVRIEIQRAMYEKLLLAHAPETRESYGAGLLRFHQFCDAEDIPESERLPANRHLLGAFVTQAMGTCTGGCVRNWLCGLQLWHIFNDAPWHGDEGWVPFLKKSAERSGTAFKRPPRGPITLAHLRALRASLDLGSPYGAAAWAAATAAFRGCRRLGELLIRSAAKFGTLRDTCRSTRISSSTVNGRRVISIHLIWTKTTTTRGGECLLTEVLGMDADLCPVWAWENHTRINPSPPPNTPLFAYRSSTGWNHITKDMFLRASTLVFRSAALEQVFGHSYRIGGSLDLLAAGVAPEVIMKLGGWTSLCFLIYWRRLAQILPLAITRAWDNRIREFATAHGHPVGTDSLSFE